MPRRLRCQSRLARTRPCGHVACRNHETLKCPLKIQHRSQLPGPAKFCPTVPAVLTTVAGRPVSHNGYRLLGLPLTSVGRDTIVSHIVTPPRLAMRRQAPRSSPKMPLQQAHLLHLHLDPGRQLERPFVIAILAPALPGPTPSRQAVAVGSCWPGLQFLRQDYRHLLP